MASRAASSLTASPLFLRDAEVRRGFEMLTFAHAQLGRAIDPILSEHRLGRAHHRALYFVARKPGLTVGALLRLLGITKQSLGRVLNELVALGLIETVANEDDRRQKLLRPTAEGKALESRLLAALTAPLRDAYQRAGQDAVSGFWQVLDGLLPVAERGLLLDLSREN